MKNKIFMLVLLIINLSWIQIKNDHFKLFKTVKKEYVLSGIKKTGTFTIINELEAKRISANEPLRALTAYYASFASSDLSDSGYSLVNAIDLKKQGSDEHLQLIKKWFLNDKIAIILLKQNCFQPAPGSSYFKSYNKLDFRVIGDTVKIDYDITEYNYGKSTSLKSTDIALVKEHEVKMLRQNIWYKDGIPK